MITLPFSSLSKRVGDQLDSMSDLLLAVRYLVLDGDVGRRQISKVVRHSKSEMLPC